MMEVVKPEKSVPAVPSESNKKKPSKKKKNPIVKTEVSYVCYLLLQIILFD